MDLDKWSPWDCVGGSKPSPKLQKHFLQVFGSRNITLGIDSPPPPDTCEHISSFSSEKVKEVRKTLLSQLFPLHPFEDGAIEAFSARTITVGVNYLFRKPHISTFCLANLACSQPKIQPKEILLLRSPILLLVHMQSYQSLRNLPSLQSAI